MQRIGRERSSLRSAMVARAVCAWMLVVGPVCGQEAASISGQVRAERGQVIASGVMLRLETANGSPIDQRYASSDGRFAFTDLPRSVYRLAVTAEGFAPLEKEINLERGVSKIFVNLYLIPANKPKTTVEPGVASVTEMSVPGKARHEYEKGVRALEERKLGAARGHFEKAVAEYPCYARAQADLAATLSAAGDGRRAEGALRKAIECDPAFLDATSQLGQLLNSERRYQESEALLRGAIERSPNTWQLYFHLGIAQYGLEEYSKAQEAYLKVRTLNPSHPSELFVKLADVYVKEQSFNKAYEEMQAYLRADPNGQFSARVKDIMRRMEASGVLHNVKAQ